MKNNKSKEEVIFDMVTTYGFPLECIEEELQKEELTYDKDVYSKLWEEHRRKSKNGKVNNIF